MSTPGGPARTPAGAGGAGPRRPPFAGSPWVARARQEHRRIDAQLTAAGGADIADRELTAQLRAQARAALDGAADAIDSFEGRWVGHRLVSSSASYRVVLGYLHNAAETLVLLQSESELLSQVPALLAAVRAYLTTEDERREEYVTYLRTLPNQPWTSPAAGTHT